MKSALVPCPKCGKDINFSKLILEWLDITGEKKLPNELFYSLWCETCQDNTIGLELSPSLTPDEALSSILESKK